jgi:hypothetical protein
MIYSVNDRNLRRKADELLPFKDFSSLIGPYIETKYLQKRHGSVGDLFSSDCDAHYIFLTHPLTFLISRFHCLFVLDVLSLISDFLSISTFHTDCVVNWFIVSFSSVSLFVPFLSCSLSSYISLHA